MPAALGKITQGNEGRWRGERNKGGVGNVPTLKVGEEETAKDSLFELLKVMIYIEYPLLKSAARNYSAARTMPVLNFHVKERNLLMLKLLFF